MRFFELRNRHLLQRWRVPKVVHFVSSRQNWPKNRCKLIGGAVQKVAFFGSGCGQVRLVRSWSRAWWTMGAERGGHTSSVRHSHRGGGRWECRRAMQFPDKFLRGMHSAERAIPRQVSSRRRQVSSRREREMQLCLFGPKNKN